MKLTKGLYYALLAAFCFSVMALCAKASHLPPQQIIFGRSVFNLVASLALLLRQGISPFGVKQNRPTLLIRGLVGYLALSFYFFSLAGLPIGVASLIQYMSPVFSGIMAFIVIKEVTSGRQWICLMAGLLGIAFISQVLPFGQLSTELDYASVLACLFSALLSGIAYVCVRKLSLAKEDPEVTVFYFPLVSLPFSLFFSLSQWVNPNAPQWWLLVAVGITSYLGQVFLTYALQREKTVSVTNMLYFGAVFATAWGVVFFAEKLTWQFLVGALLIVGSQLVFGKKPSAVETID